MCTDHYFKVRSTEGVSVVEEAIRELELTEPLPTLQYDESISQASQEIVDVEADGHGHGHGEQPIARLQRIRKGLTCSQRLSRYGTWSGICAENISTGRLTARAIVLQVCGNADNKIGDVVDLNHDL